MQTVGKGFGGVVRKNVRGREGGFKKKKKNDALVELFFNFSIV